MKIVEAIIALEFVFRIKVYESDQWHCFGNHVFHKPHKYIHFFVKLYEKKTYYTNSTKNCILFLQLIFLFSSIPNNFDCQNVGQQNFSKNI